MAKCTGVRCPMQHGYKVDECNHTDCPYRTEPMTNADRIRAMSDEELGALLCGFRLEGYGECSLCPLEWKCDSGRKWNLIWLKDSNSEEWDYFMENYVKKYID